ncbi:retrovirus-related pol polyprotein from transposon TNT 1-94 [Tanacetum coccineum]
MRSLTSKRSLRNGPVAKSPWTNWSLSKYLEILSKPLEEKVPLSPLPKLTGAEPSGASKSLISLFDLTTNMADLTLNTASKNIKKSSDKVSQTYVIKKKTKPKHPAVQISFPDKNALPSIEKLLLTLMEEVKGIKNQILIPLDTSSSVSQASSSKTPRQKVWYGPCKHCGMKNHLSDDCYSKPKCSTYGSCSYTIKEDTEQSTVGKYLNNLKGQSTSKPTPTRINRISKTFRECKYCGSNKHHPDDCEFYPWCEICRSIAHEIDDYPKNLRNNSGCSRHMIGVKQYMHIYLKESGPKVVSGDNSSGDTEDMAQLTIMESHSPRRRDVYVIDMSSYDTDSNACFYDKASPSVNWLWHKRLSHLNFKTINNLSKYNLVSRLPSLTFSKDRNYSACEKGKHHRATFKTKRHMENLNDTKVKQLRSDNGTEFRNHTLEAFCGEKGISQNFSSPCTPEQNGVAERRNRTLIEAARTMLNSASLPKQF